MIISSKVEKRSFQRQPVNMKVDFMFGNETHSGTARNVSRKGMLIFSPVVLPVNSELDLFFPYHKGVMRLTSRVRRISSSAGGYNGMGVELPSPPKEYQTFLARLSPEVAGKTGSGDSIKDIFRCGNCNHIVFLEAPAVCPFCGRSIDAFERDQEGVRVFEECEDIGELEWQHFPYLTITRENCSHRECEYINVNVKIGEILHPMQTDDHITLIDFYFEEPGRPRKCISRVNLNCRSMSPETSIRLRDVSSGILSVISHCSIHGRWITEVQV